MLWFSGKHLITVFNLQYFPPTVLNAIEDWAKLSNNLSPKDENQLSSATRIICFSCVLAILTFIFPSLTHSLTSWILRAPLRTTKSDKLARGWERAGAVLFTFPGVAKKLRWHGVIKWPFVEWEPILERIERVSGRAGWERRGLRKGCKTKCQTTESLSRRDTDAQSHSRQVSRMTHLFCPKSFMIFL